ncbi:MAG: ABC transporter substrate-binding protein [Pseudomonadota bacterium]
MSAQLRSILLLLALSLSLPGWAAAPLRLVSDENAPYASTDPASKAVVGITFEMLAEAFRRADLPYTTEVYPWARAYFRAQNETDTCVYPLARLAEREALFQWIGPLSKNKWVLFARNDFTETVASVDDARKYRIGGLLQDGPSVLLRSLGVRVELVGTNELNLNKLAAGRIDLWATGYFRGKIVAGKGGVGDLKPVFVLQEVDHYLACHRKVPAYTVQALNQAVETMWRDGWMKKISDRYQEKPLN